MNAAYILSIIYFFYLFACPRIFALLQCYTYNEELLFAMTYYIKYQSLFPYNS